MDVPVQIVQPGNFIRLGVACQQGFPARFSDVRNVGADGVAPYGGLPFQPVVVPPRR